MSDKIRTMLTDQGIALCIPAERNRNQPVEHSKKLYKMRRQGENPFARLKDWRRIATRYDRYAHIFRSAVLLAAILISWL